MAKYLDTNKLIILITISFFLFSGDSFAQQDGARRQVKETNKIAVGGLILSGIGAGIGCTGAATSWAGGDAICEAFALGYATCIPLCAMGIIGVAVSAMNLKKTKTVGDAIEGEDAGAGGAAGGGAGAGDLGLPADAINDPDVRALLNEKCPGVTDPNDPKCVEALLNGAHSGLVDRQASLESQVGDDPSLQGELDQISNLVDGLEELASGNLSEATAARLGGSTGLSLDGFGDDEEFDEEFADGLGDDADGEVGGETSALASGKGTKKDADGKAGGKKKTKSTLFNNFFSKKLAGQNIKSKNGLSLIDANNSNRPLSIFERAERRYIGMMGQKNMKRAFGLAKNEFKRQQHIRRIVAKFKKGNRRTASKVKKRKSKPVE